MYTQAVTRRARRGLAVLALAVLIAWRLGGVQLERGLPSLPNPASHL